MTPSGNETADFWLVEYCLNRLRHRVPQNNKKLSHSSHFLADFPFYSKTVCDNLVSIYC